MKYSKYFGIVFKSQGIPKISVEQKSRLMNIVSMEGELDRMRNMKDPNNKTRDHSIIPHSPFRD